MPSIKSKIIGVFEDRAPNMLFPELIQHDIPERKIDEINTTLNSLMVEGRIISTGNSSFKLADYSNISIREFIQLDDLKIRRLLANDPISAEAINMSIEELSLHSKKLESKFSKLVALKMKAYWNNIIVIFGLFISVFAIITTMTSKIQINDSWSLSDIFLKNLMQISPILIIMSIFVIVLKIIFK